MKRSKYRRYLKQCREKRIPVILKRKNLEHLEKIGGIGGIKTANKALDYVMRERKN